MGHYAIGTVVLVSLKVFKPELKQQLPHLLCVSLHYYSPPSLYGMVQGQ